LWYASAIVHESGRAKLYSQNRRRFHWFMYSPRDAWTGTAAEQVWLRLQLAALRELGAALLVQEYVESLLKNPTYHGQSTVGYGRGPEPPPFALRFLD